MRSLDKERWCDCYIVQDLWKEGFAESWRKFWPPGGEDSWKSHLPNLSMSSDFIQALLFDEEARPIGAWERPGLLSPVAQGRRQKRCGFNPWIRKICWRRARQPSPGFLPGEFPWPEELGGPLSMGSPRVRHDWSNLACTHACGTRRHEMFWDGMDGCSWISFPWASWCCFDTSQRQGWKWSSQPHYHTHLHAVTKVV